MKKTHLTTMTLLLITGIMCITACGKKPVQQEEGGVTLEVQAHYGGYGVTGQDLGSGTDIYEITGIKEGDIICETFGELKKAEDPSEYNGDPFLKIDSINEDGVKVLVTQGDYTMGYDRGKYGFNMLYGVGSHFDSLHYIYDGINYTYYLTFTDGTEET